MSVEKLITAGNLAAGETLVIERDGSVRLLDGSGTVEPGELVLSNPNPSEPNLNIGLADDDNDIQDITSEIDEILAALEEGQDPTELGDEFATAAGGQVGSGPSGIESIVRTAEITTPGTDYETSGIFGQFGLTTTQSLTLLNQFQAFQQSPTFTDTNSNPIGDDLSFVTNEDTSVSGQVFATDPNPDDILAFSITSQPSNGSVELNSVSGTWTYVPNNNFDGNDTFIITVDDGNGGTDSLSVDIEVVPIPEVSLIGPSSLNEGENANYVIEFDKPSTQVTNITLSISTSTAELEDLTAVTVTTADGTIISVGPDGTIEVPIGVTSLDVSVGTLNDTVFEGNETFQVGVASGFGTLGEGEQNTVILDNDTPTLSVSTETVVEGQAALFDVALSNEVDGDVRYEFTIDVDGQSAELADFASNPLSVTYKVGETSFNAAANGDGSYTIPGNASDIKVSVQTSDDTIFEGSETFNLDARATATVGGESFDVTDSGAGTITDDRDGMNNADTPTLSVSTETVVEGQAALFDVALSNEVDGDVRYEFTIDVDGQSAELADFASNPLSVTYKVGETSFNAAANGDGSYTIPGNASDIKVSVQTSDDTIFEGSETFNLDARATATVGGESFDVTDSGAGTITDDRDGMNNADTPTLSVSTETVVEGQAALFDVALSNEVDGDVRYEFTIDVDGQSAELADFASNPLSVTYKVGETSFNAAANGDGSYTIPGNASDIKVSVQTSDDTIFEGSETFNLDARATATVGGESFDVTDSGAGTITDDRDGMNNADTPTLSVSTETVVEGQAALFDVALSNEVDGDVRYEFTIDVDGQSAELADFASNPLSVTYKVGETSFNAAANGDGSYTIPGNASDIKVSVQTSDDTIFEGSETFNLDARATATVGGESFDVTDSGAGTITDDRDGMNNADTPTLSVSTETVVEGQAALFDVALSNEVDGDVRYEFTIDVDGQSAELADFASNPLSVTYKVGETSFNAAANGDGSYTIPGNASDIKVSVQTSDDTIFEGSETFNLDARATATVGGESFDVTDSGAGTITDDRDGMNNADTPTLSVSTETVVEGQAALFDVALSNEVDGDVRYEFTIDVDGQSAELADFASNPLSVTYKVGETSFNAAANGDGSYTIPGNASDIKVSVQTSDDTIFEGSETFNLDARATATVGGESFDVTDSGAGTITDDRDGMNNADTPTLSVSTETVVEGQAALFDVALSNEVDGDVRYEFTIDVDGQSAELADFASNPLSVTYKVGETSFNAAANGDGSYTIPGNASDIKVSVQTSDDTIFEGSETFNLDARATATVGGESFDVTDSGAGTITDDRDGMNNADTPTLSVSTETVVEGQAALFDVALSNEVDGDVRYEFTIDVDGQSAELADFASNPLSVTYKVGETSFNAAANGDGSYTIPGNASDIKVSVQTSDDTIFEGSETFNLDARATATVGGENFDVTDSGAGTITDNSDRPAVSITGGGEIAEGDTAHFTVLLSNTATSEVSFVLTLEQGDTSAQDIAAYQYQDTNGVWQDVPVSGEILVPAGSDSVNVRVVTAQDTAYEGDESFTLSVAAGQNTVLGTSTSASATILDFADNPPQAEDFSVALDANGHAGIFFDSHDVAQDHISDDEDDASNTPVGVVITELPQSGQLYYDNQLIDASDVTTFSANGEVLQQGTVFSDPNLIRYENDSESTGFVLGVKQTPEGMDGNASQSTFLNWGEAVEGNPAQRVMQFDNGDAITITSASQPLTQYFAGASHIGYGLGVGDDGGIQQGETITIDLSDRPSTSIEVGLDGLGGWFEEGHRNETTAVVQAVLDDGSVIDVPVTKDTSGNTDLFHVATIDAPEGREIESVIVTTEGPGNWELRYLEASSSDTFDYRAVDSDGNHSDEHTVTLVEGNTAPIAADDPVAFDVALGTFNSSSWSHDGVSVSASYQGQEKTITEGGVKRGVSGDENGGPGAQIQYNREDGESEQLTVSLDKPATEFSFEISNLYKNEGGRENHEQGKWVAYLGDNPVASGTFVANESNNRGTYHFDEEDLGGVAFDTVVFEALDFTNTPARGSDSSDYFLTGFKASGEGSYAANQGEVLEIPVTELLGNDVDPNGDNIRITHVSDVNNAQARIENGVVYIDLEDSFVGETSFDYVITDDKGGYSEATVSVVVNPLPQDVAVSSVSMLDETVTEGDNLVYQVSLEEGVLQETRYSVTFGQPDTDTADNADVDLSQAVFTHGVTYDAVHQQLVVPVGINAFSIVIPTVLDGVYEHAEDYTLVVGGENASGVINNVDIPLVSVSGGGDVSEGSGAEFTVSLSKNTAQAVTVNLLVSHSETDASDISNMDAAYHDGQGWQSISIADNGDLVIPAGVTQVRVTVHTADDNAQPIYEGAESFALVVSGVEGAQGLDSKVSTISDDGRTGLDDDRPVVISVSEGTVAEGSDAIFNVALSSQSTSDTSIALELKERTASSPEDYNGSAVTVSYGDPEQSQVVSIQNGLFQFNLPAGESDFSVSVHTVDDEVSENNETFLLAASTEHQSNQISAKATIEDNEKPLIDLDGSQYQVEFVSEDAGYSNVFGYYVYDPASDIQQLQVLMSDSHDTRQDGFEPVLASLDSLDNVEYFLIADGARLVDSVSSDATFEVNSDGRLMINGSIQDNAKVLLSHDEASLMRTTLDDNGDTIIYFDDQVDHARDDNDYNDLIVKIAKQDTNIDFITDFTEGDGPIAVADTDANIFDDKDTLHSMHVSLNQRHEGDQLTWLPMAGFTVSQSSTASGLSLLITSDALDGASAAEFEAFLQGIKYQNISENPDETDREIKFYVTDSYGQNSDIATTIIAVSEVPDLSVQQRSSGTEDSNIALNISLPQGSSVDKIVVSEIPPGAVLTSGNNPISVSNGEAKLTLQQLQQLTITPPNNSDENFVLKVQGYTADNELIEEHDINVQVDAQTDAPTVTVSEPEVISLNTFDSIDLSNRSWRGDVTSSELTQADGVLGTWGTDNPGQYNEVGKESVYRGGASDGDNQLYELEGRRGDDQLFTEFSAEADQFYTLSFDVVARRVNDSPMTVFLEDENGTREVLFDYTDKQSLTWHKENINFQTPSSGSYKIVFESETSSNSYGALLDDIKLEKANNVGLEDSYISLSEIAVSLNDTDGSETLSLLLNGLPEGSIIRDGNGHSIRVLATEDGKNSVDLSAWTDDLTGLEVYVLDEGDYPLELIATAQDNAPATSESVSQFINLHVLPDPVGYAMKSGSHGHDVIEGSDTHDLIVGDVQGIQIIAGQDYNIAFVLDTSGSMRNSVATAKSEIIEVFEQLYNTVNSGPNTGKVNMLLTEFATSTGVVISVDLNSPSALTDFISQLSDIEDSGSGYTNYEASFNATIEWFDANTNEQAENITYFITDGNPNYIHKHKLDENRFDEVVLDFDASNKEVVTLDDILPSDYQLGTSVIYKGQELVSGSGAVKSPLTGSTLGNLTHSNGLRYSDSNSITIHTHHMYQVLLLMSSIEAIGIGDSINAATLSEYDSDGTVVSNINVDRLAETILGQEVALNQGQDEIIGGDGNDILFGDLINFDSIDGQGISALQKYVSAETSDPLADVSSENISSFVRQNYSNFDVSRQNDQNDILQGGLGDDILYGQGGDDTLDGGAGDDILLGGQGDDILIGGQGDDILTGGSGQDQFVWKGSDIDGGKDVITDFHVSEDKINVSDLLVGSETIDDLLSDISANVDNNDIELVIQRDSGQHQSIKLENVVDQFSGLDLSSGSVTGTDLTSLLSELMMTHE